MRPRLVRALAGAAVGSGLVLFWWGLIRLWPRWPLNIVRDDSCRNFGCALGTALISLVLTVAVILAGSIAIGWVLLWAIRVRPAWPVAILGPVLGWVLLQLIGQAQTGSVGWIVLGMAIGYAFAGFISARRSA